MTCRANLDPFSDAEERHANLVLQECPGQVGRRSKPWSEAPHRECEREVLLPRPEKFTLGSRRAQPLRERQRETGQKPILYSSCSTMSHGSTATT